MTQPETNTGRVALEGAQTIRTADAARTRLLAALNDHPLVEIDCSAATEIDVSIVQLIIAARRSAAAAGKRLVLARPVEGALRDALTRGGFLPANPAGPWTDEEMFWVTGSSAA